MDLYYHTLTYLHGTAMNHNNKFTFIDIIPTSYKAHIKLYHSSQETSRH